MSNGLKSNSSKVVQVGFAMFSMFFGSGNTVFPVLVGVKAGTQMIPALFGFVLTGVCVPFLGLLSMFFFQGDYFKFFKRLGNIPAWAIVIIIMLLIGPFAIIPRCILISYGTLQGFAPELNKYFFSLASCLIILACTYRRSRIIEILGLYLTPVLIFSIVVIVLLGLFSPNPASQSTMSTAEALDFGLVEGYNTMDIFAGFMFAGILLASIRTCFTEKDIDHCEVLKLSVKAGVVGISLLAAVYLGLGYISSYQTGLSHISKDKILSQLAQLVLGKEAAVLVCLTVSLACLTTAISLAMVFSEFLSQKIFQGKLSYRSALALTMVLSFCFSLLGFDGVQKVVVPILQLCYPVLILLAVLNLLYKTIGFKPVKVPCLLLFLYSAYIRYPF